MKSVFADTFYFLALVNRKDKAHRRCAFSQTSDRSVVTSTWVLLELGDALRRGRDRAAFSAHLNDVANDSDTIVARWLAR